MSREKLLRGLVLATMVSLVAGRVVDALTEFGGAVSGAVGAVVAGGVYVFCGRMARHGVRSALWIAAPTLLFTVLPVAISLWNFFSEEEQAGWLVWLWRNGGLLLGFVVPLGLLSWLYVALLDQPTRD